MRTLLFGTLTALSLSGASIAGAVSQDEAAEEARDSEQVREVAIENGKAELSVDELERVDSFSMFGRPHSWTAVDNDTVIVWTTAFRPYLIELAYPSHDLRFAQVIGVTSVGRRVHAKFDSVQVRGLRYPISNIYKMTREEAKSWNRSQG